MGDGLAQIAHVVFVTTTTIIAVIGVAIGLGGALAGFGPPCVEHSSS
jgi:hypothetical protein